MSIALRMTNATGYVLTVHPYGSATSTFTGTLISQADSAIRRVRVWNYNSGVNGENNEGRNFYVNDLRVQGGPVPRGRHRRHEVRIVRASDGNGDGLPDWWQIEHWGSAGDPDRARRGPGRGRLHQRAGVPPTGTDPGRNPPG